MLKTLIRTIQIITSVVLLAAVTYQFAKLIPSPSLLYPVWITIVIVLHPLILIFGAFYGGKVGAWLIAAHLALVHVGWWMGVLVGGNGWRGLALITAPTFVLFWTGLISFSIFVMPLETHEWSMAARTLLGFVTGHHYAYHRVKDVKTKELVEGKLMRKGLYPGLIVNKAHTAVPVSTGTGFSRVAGPGFTFIDRAERPHQEQVIDLRTQIRLGKVRATTRDGIDVEFWLPVVFRIEQSPPTRPPAQITPFSESAVFNAVTAQRATQEGLELAWDEIPHELARNHARTVIAEYPLDRLLEDENQAQQSPHDPMEQTAQRRRRLYEEHRATMPRDRIRAEIQKRLQAEIAGLVLDNGRPQPDNVKKRYGIKILGVGLGNIEVAGATDEDCRAIKDKPKTEEDRKLWERVMQAESVKKEILAQRIMNWQAGWMAEVIHRQAQSEAEATREIGRARAQSQMRMIQALTEGFEQAKSAGLKTHTDIVVLLRLLDAIEGMAREPGTREHVPDEALHTQAIMRKAALQRAAGH
jgi:regulator of protease activity HflC (stomatin/prohibitin superfamily)